MNKTQWRSGSFGALLALSAVLSACSNERGSDLGGYAEYFDDHIYAHLEPGGANKPPTLTLYEDSRIAAQIDWPRFSIEQDGKLRRLNPPSQLIADPVGAKAIGD